MQDGAFNRNRFLFRKADFPCGDRIFSIRTPKDVNAVPYERNAEPQPHNKLRRTLIKDLRKSQLKSSWIVGRNPWRALSRTEMSETDSWRDASATHPKQIDCAAPSGAEARVLTVPTRHGCSCRRLQKNSCDNRQFTAAAKAGTESRPLIAALEALRHPKSHSS